MFLQILNLVMHGFILTRLDDRNALFTGLNQNTRSRLQLAQNLLSGTKKHEHITSILASLHWLPLPFRIYFKILLFLFKSLNGLAPLHISDIIQIYTPWGSVPTCGS